MKARTILSAPLLLLLFFVIVIPVAAQSPSPQQTLNQYVADLQKNPNDYALREKIIKLVQTLKPAPVIPEEARRHYVMALTLFKGAKKIEDYSESIEEFRGALLVAPWWAEANRDLGMALEAAQRYDEAISALKLYITSGLGEEKMRAAQDEIYKIEGMKKLAAREREESFPQAVAAREQNKFEELLRKIDGRRYTCSVGQGQTQIIVVRGKVFVLGNIAGDGTYLDLGRVEILGRETTVHSSNIFYGNVENTYIISEDGDTITLRSRSTGGKYKGGEYGLIYLWQR
jgi:tetratricopeptide (TPR) repeat protein